MSKIGRPGKDKEQKRHAMNRAEHRLRFHLSEKEYEQIEAVLVALEKFSKGRI